MLISVIVVEKIDSYQIESLSLRFSLVFELYWEDDIVFLREVYFIIIMY